MSLIEASVVDISQLLRKNDIKEETVLKLAGKKINALMHAFIFRSHYL